MDQAWWPTWIHACPQSTYDWSFNLIKIIVHRISTFPSFLPSSFLVFLSLLSVPSRLPLKYKKGKLSCNKSANRVVVVVVVVFLGVGGTQFVWSVCFIVYETSKGLSIAVFEVFHESKFRAKFIPKVKTIYMTERLGCAVGTVLKLSLVLPGNYHISIFLFFLYSYIFKVQYILDCGYTYDYYVIHNSKCS